MATKSEPRGIGNLIAPPRFLLFLLVVAIGCWLAIPPLGLRHGVMAGFDAGAVAFLIAFSPLLSHESGSMRASARRNDANRVVLLLITSAVSVVILVAIASELMQRQAPHPTSLVLIVGTLAMSWLFSNLIYALHYAHIFYTAADGGDEGGLEFPKTSEPDYWDFIYFAYCLGMTFQTSDVSITSGRMRRVVTLHCLAAFVFNLGVIAFTINVLGGS
ncbi:DUF1345 domain-containing protein [Sphingomonas sp. HF-S3]|uniref:DUF1345 domain-containing protein n=1 Tax=Sphingomonas rustica TaxID=3103142 RepID=A0ABV0B922_9SPHN